MSPRTGENIPAISHTSQQSRSQRSHGKVLALLADSSEDEPSPHSSIYEALLASDSETEGIKSSRNGGSPVRRVDIGVDNITEDEDVGQEHGLPSTEEMNTARSGVIWNLDNRRISRPSPVLETIVEQKCNNTLGEESAFPRLDRRSSSEFSEEDNDDGDDAQLLPRAESLRSNYFDYYNNEVYDYASPSQPLYQSISALDAGEIILLCFQAVINILISVWPIM